MALTDPLIQLGRTPQATELGQFALTVLQRLAESDPANGEWQRDLWVSYWRIAKLLEQQQSSDAITYWRKAYDTMAAMEKAGLFVSPQDQQFLIRLRQKIGS